VTPGSSLRLVAQKWPDLPHWEHDAVLLGDDDHGRWVGAPAGTVMRRPGVEFVTQCAQVSLLPAGAPFVATFYEPGGPVDVYVDISTAPVWDGDRVSAVDLDLDVVRGWTGRVWVDDEDEFAAHRVSLGYPADVVSLATRSCDVVLAAVRGRQAPYAGDTGRRWLRELHRLSERMAR
jgi:protein associated with RNAse G/E